MKWITRSHVHVDRVACPWLIKRFVDNEAEFLFVPNNEVMNVAKREGAIPFDARGQAELDHYEGRCSFVGANGKRCNSTWDLEIDHVIPYARGGGNTPDNLRLLCRRHNMHEAGKMYGGAFMKNRTDE